MILTCEKCNFVAKTSRDYNRHILTKKHLLRINDNAKYKCLCGKTYKSAQSVYQHRIQCTYSPPNIETNTSEVQTLRKENQEMREILDKNEKEMDELRKKVEFLFEKTSGNTTNNNNTNNINSQTNIENKYIVVNSFGNENIEKIHFDPEHPENHNITITNKYTIQGFK